MNVDYREIEKYIERHYELEALSIEQYIELTEILSKKAQYEIVLSENKRHEMFSALIRKRIDPHKMSVEEFESIVCQLCNASTKKEIYEIMSSYNLN